MMTTMTRRALRDDALPERSGLSGDHVSLAPPPPDSLPTSTVEPVLLRAMQRVRGCPPGCRCRGTKTSFTMNETPFHRGMGLTKENQQ